MNIGPLALAPNMMAQRPYDAVADFTAIGQVIATYFVVATPATLPRNTVKQFIDWARANEGKVNFASGGNGSITHLNGELLDQVAGTRMTPVPYEGTAPAVADLIAGQTQILMDIMSVLSPQVRAGTSVVERNPEEFAAFIKSENERWLPLILASGAKIE